MTEVLIGKLALAPGTSESSPDLDDLYRQGARHFENRNWSAQDLSRLQLSGATFRKCSLAGADLTGTNLEGATFEQTNLSDAKLVGANLSSANLSGIDLNRADLTGAILRRSQLDRSDLAEARLDKADMTDASLVDANLTRASLIKAKLDGTGIEDAHMPGANLSDAVGAGVQDRLKARLDVAKVRADGLRPVFIGAAGVFGYIGISVLGTKDALILTNLATMDLPLVSVKVPVQAFFLAAGFVCLSMLAFILAQVGYFARIAARLPARLPQGPALRELIDPWVLNSMGIHRRPDLPLRGTSQLTNVVRTTFELFGSWLPGFLTRWMGCLILWLLMLRFLVACGSLKHNLLFSVLALMFLLSWTIAFGLVSYAELIEGTSPRAKWQMHVTMALGAIALAFLCRWGLSIGFYRGMPGDDLQKAALVEANLREWNFAGCNLENASLSHSDLSGAFLQESKLRGADLRRTTLTRTSFAGATLQHATLATAHGTYTNFWWADLEDADLRGARLEGAILHFAKLGGSRLQQTNFENALGVGADFSKLGDKNTLLNESTFDGAWLGGASFAEAIAQRSSFVGADLVSVNFEKTYLNGANFRRANLSYAVMAGAHLEGANFGQSLLHGTVFKDAGTWNVQFRNARIFDVDFSGNLAKSDFTGAQLARVTLNGADLYFASFASAKLCKVNFAQSRNTSQMNLRNARIYHADLRNLDLSLVDLEGATLTDVNLDGTTLNGPKLAKTAFRHVSATGAKGANIDGVALTSTRTGGAELNSPGDEPKEPPPGAECREWTEVRP